MLSMLRTRLGIPGVISVIALVFAMLGGAYAANDSGGGDTVANASKKAKGPRGPRGPKGATGAAGAAGAQGPAGAQGAVGPQGPAGADGKAGATGPTGPAGAAGTPGTPGSTGATGPAGSPWTAGGTLPSGETETGVWAGRSFEEEEEVRLPISFAIPLASPLDNAHVEIVGSTINPNCDDGVEPAASSENPEAEPGFLCVFQGRFGGPGSPVRVGKQGDATQVVGASTTGAVLGVFTEAFKAQGSWAVTAP